MPIEIVKTGKHYMVINQETGQVHSKSTSRTNALAQKRLLDSLDVPLLRTLPPKPLKKIPMDQFDQKIYDRMPINDRVIINNLANQGVFKTPDSTYRRDETRPFVKENRILEDNIKLRRMNTYKEDQLRTANRLVTLPIPRQLQIIREHLPESEFTVRNAYRITGVPIPREIIEEYPIIGDVPIFHHHHHYT
jgi:hypothetical protein